MGRMVCRPSLGVNPFTSEQRHKRGGSLGRNDQNLRDARLRAAACFSLLIGSDPKCSVLSMELLQSRRTAAKGKRKLVITPWSIRGEVKNIFLPRPEGEDISLPSSPCG